MLQELLACLILVVALWHIKRKWFSPFADFPRPDTLPLIGTLTKYWNSDYMDTTLEIAKDFKEQGLYHESNILTGKGPFNNYVTQNFDLPTYLRNSFL